MFTKGQIVKGIKTGDCFKVLGTKLIAGEPMVVLKSVNPEDHTQVGRGQLCLPADALVAA